MNYLQYHWQATYIVFAPRVEEGPSFAADAAGTTLMESWATIGQVHAIKNYITGGDY
jgi:hypothetical protein